MIAVSQTAAKLDTLASEINDETRLVPVCLDVGDWVETEQKLADHFDSIDYLVNNAGCAIEFAVDEVEEAGLDRMLNVNLKGPLNLIRLVAPGMKKRRYGSIVNVSSISGVAALDGHVGYAATKAALDMVTRVSSKELAAFNVRVNSVNPTVVWTQMGREHWADDVKRNTMLSRTPIGRFAEVDEVVKPILFLLSDQSSMINGIYMPIDGGFLAT